MDRHPDTGEAGARKYYPDTGSPAAVPEPEQAAEKTEEGQAAEAVAEIGAGVAQPEKKGEAIKAADVGHIIFGLLVIGFLIYGLIRFILS